MYPLRVMMALILPIQQNDIDYEGIERYVS